MFERQKRLNVLEVLAIQNRLETLQIMDKLDKPNSIQEK